MASFPAAYLALAIFARFNIGERHVLPLYPFALLFAAVVWEWADAKACGVRQFLVLLVLLNAADALRYAPGYLSYFNVFVRPADSYRLLTDSNLDWGQGLLALRAISTRPSRGTDFTVVLWQCRPRHLWNSGPTVSAKMNKPPAL